MVDVVKHKAVGVNFIAQGDLILKWRKLTAADVMYIRRSKLDNISIAKKLGVSRSVVYDARKGRSYGWVVDENSIHPSEANTMSREDLMESILSGYEWVGPLPQNVSLAIKSLRSSGKKVLRITRYQIIESDDFD